LRIPAGDRELLDLKSCGKMEIVSPRAFWERVRSAVPR